MRFVFALLSSLSLALCAMSVALWVRSYSGTDYAERIGPTKVTSSTIEHQSHRIAWTLGDIRLSVDDHTYYASQAMADLAGRHPAQWSYGRLGAGHTGFERFPERSIWNRLRFHEFSGGWESSFASEGSRGVAVPAWLGVAPFVLLPGFWAVGTIRRRRRRVAGYCPGCGYDMRATPERCPECGRAKNLRASD